MFLHIGDIYWSVLLKCSIFEWKFRKQGYEGKEAHIGQAYTCINLNLLLGYEIAEQSSNIFPK